MKPRGLLLLITGCALFTSCKDFFTKKIGNDSVVILAPANNTITTSNSITFWWQALDGADSYNLQLVKPNFAAAQVLVADTNVTGTKLQLSLTPGTYQWRIQGVNGGGTSKYTLYNLTIDSTSNLSGQLVVPTGPAVNYVTAATSITFSWNPITAADKYELYINTNPPTDIITTNPYYTVSTFTAGSYTWKVRAQNAFSISQYNTPRAFKIDLTSPGAPNALLATMANSINVKATDTLKWHRTSGDVQYDSIYIYNDAAMASVNSTSNMPVVRVSINSFLSAPSVATPYWWRVKSVDSVGNRSVFSAVSSFTLTP